MNLYPKEVKFLSLDYIHLKNNKGKGEIQVFLHTVCWLLSLWIHSCTGSTIPREPCAHILQSCPFHYHENWSSRRELLCFNSYFYSFLSLHVWVSYHIKVNVIFTAYSLFPGVNRPLQSQYCWVQLHGEIRPSDKMLHSVNRRNKNIPWPLANNVLLQWHTKSRCARWRII